ncbi:polymorphic toxin-type HINT domain-containing protein [Streptacidiphilus sp. P02-A3a]|uniref:polymorphic toxin-type HINT domain-containing protein n=1 Tax=Streptacidiphilus sp. P02-A3a TaxID=2704468 RepID=UPI0015FD403B|nr:polymorphic toxin-type HINT domain-containing protein [Streptacidiphilus sp. P02-A3a]QMU70028.1 sugar-binding protein [Streptacidiphilus sp. P02-A3a]
MAVTATGAMLASLLGGPAVAVAATKASAPKPAGVKPVTGLTPVPVKPQPVEQMPTTVKATAVTWPAATSGSAVVAVPARGQSLGAKVKVGATPVWVQRLGTAAANTAKTAKTAKTEAPKGAVAVKVLAHSTATDLDVSGVVFTVSGPASAGRLQVGLDYDSFAQAYGGDYASRLRLVQLPGCALTTPQLAACRRQTPLASSVDYLTTSVSAPISLPASTTSQASGTRALTSSAALGSEVIAATDSTGQEGGATGSYAASVVSPSSSWTESGASGSWDYTYPVTLPNAPTPLEPTANLSYDSGSVDGQTASTEAQSSWVGDGWSTADSSISQTFTPCDDDPEGTAAPSSTNDECYDGQILTLSLNGQSTPLVYDNGTYTLADDDGDTVTHVTSSGNGSGTYNTDYWVVTDRSGIKYEFGRNELPGWKTGDATTGSVDTEPVYSAHSGDPCYSTSGFTSSECTMAYQWHLDYVVSPDKGAMAYYYDQATNYYGADNGAKNGSSSLSYVRDSYLDHVDYGFQDGGAYGTVPDKVLYSTASRCVATTCGSLSSITAATAATEYPDVPFDLLCAQGATCTSYGTSFFSTVRLTGITTEQYSTANSAYEKVDGYSLTQTEPLTGDGTSPTLWLSQINHTGYDTSAGGSTTAIALPPITFSGIDLQNRVSTANYPGLYRWRINKVTTETDEVIGVTYGLPDACTATSVASITPSSNTSSCYPVYWTPLDYSAPVEDWFEKYAVTQVLETDSTGGALTEETDYKYPGAPAWHYDDNEVVKPKYRSWGQFRGYADVETLTGDIVNDPQTESITSYYQGMDGDYLTASTTRSVSLTDSQGGQHTDSDELAGNALETTTYLGAGGPIDHSTISSYWVSGAVATRTRTGLPALTANMTGQVESWTRQAVTVGGTTTWRVTESDDSYDTAATDPEFGLVEHSYTHTVPADSAYDSCTSTSYAAPNTALNLVGLASSTETDSVACSGFTEGSVSSTPAALNTLGAPASVTAAQVVSADRSFYDDTTFSTAFPQANAPTVGEVTMTQKASGGTPGAFTWQTESRKTYDAHGQVADSYDPDGNLTATTTSYNTVGLATARVVTDALSQTSSVTLDPTRALTLTATDANGVVSTEHYDALGRLVDVWKDSRATSTPANIIYSYTVSDTSVSGTTTQTMNDELGYETSVTVDDAMGRVRQTQTPTAQGGRLITDDFYDSRGWLSKKNTGCWDPSTTPVLALDSIADNKVADQDQYTLDGLGRTVVDTSLQYSVVKSVTTTVYNGSTTTVIPPTGGTVTATSTDPLGRTTTVAQYTTAPTLTQPSNTFTGLWYVTGGTTDPISYGYDGHGNQAVTTNAGSTWTSTYNLLGQITAKTDPDAGTSTMVYDADGNLLQSEDADGTYTSTTYDALSRKTATYASTTAAQAPYVSAATPGNETASWGYDNANNAVPGMTYPLGETTTETAYDNGYPYVTQSLGFNVFGESLGESVTVPSAAQGTGLGTTWTIKHGYSLNTGLLSSDTYPAGAGLPLETVLHTYTTALDLPNGLASSYGYSQGTSYDAYGNVEQQSLGTSGSEAYVTNTYDPHTNALTDQLVTRSTNPTAVDDEAYGYNADGQITAETDTRLGSAANSETQCYTYDSQNRLDAAWTATDQCAATPTPGNDSTVGDLLGSASAYWSTWTFTPTGQRATETDYATGTTSTATTTTTTDSYNGNATGQAHTLTSTSTGTSGSSTAYTYDADGNMTTRTTPANGAQTIRWNNQDQVTSVTGSATGSGSDPTAGDSSYLYDADGNILLQIDGDDTTLYAASEEITDDATTSTVTGVRYYALPGGGTAVRNAAGTNYDFELANQQGTGELYLDSTGQTPTWRQFTPYGAPRGTTTTWVDNRGFLNSPTDATTGLTLDGARQYDPTTGTFISLDPLFEATDTQELNGYSYAANNPVDGSDPTGTAVYLQAGGDPVGHGGVVNGQKRAMSWLNSQIDREAARGLYWSVWSDSFTSLAIIADQERLAEEQTEEAELALAQEEQAEAELAQQQIQSQEEAARKASHHGWLGALEDVAEQALPVVADVVVDGVVEVATDGAATAALPEIDELMDGGIEGAEEGDSEASCLVNSFAATTLVLMAGGKTKPISAIKPGDHVETANPETGKPDGSRPVVATMVHYDHNLIDVNVRDSHGHVSTLHTTTEHAFWDDTLHTWVPANQLTPGHALETPTAQPAHVATLQATPGAANRYNLTVQQLHTYYVLAGTTPILVHNCGGADDLSKSATDPLNGKAGDSPASRAYQKHMNRPGTSLINLNSGRERVDMSKYLINDLLTNPKTAVQAYTNPEGRNVAQYLLPDMGASWDTDTNEFIGFLDH